MGYTHRFQATRPTKDLAAVARKVVAASDVEICGPVGVDKPTLRATGIHLNGSEALGEDYETFSILNKDEPCGWFCKTARNPYDEVVTAILVHAILTDNGKVGSDGYYEEWADGIALYEKAMGRKLTETEYRKLEDTLGLTPVYNG